MPVVKRRFELSNFLGSLNSERCFCMARRWHYHFTHANVFDVEYSYSHVTTEVVSCQAFFIFRGMASCMQNGQE